MYTGSGVYLYVFLCTCACIYMFHMSLHRCNQRVVINITVNIDVVVIIINTNSTISINSTINAMPMITAKVCLQTIMDPAGVCVCGCVCVGLYGFWCGSMWHQWQYVAVMKCSKQQILPIANDICHIYIYIYTLVYTYVCMYVVVLAFHKFFVSKFDVNVKLFSSIWQNFPYIL